MEDPLDMGGSCSKGRRDRLTDQALLGEGMW